MFSIEERIGGGLEELGNESQLKARHKQELKDLQGKIQALKKSVTKGDKKKKKELTALIAQMESDMMQRHAAELELLTGADVRGMPFSGKEVELKEEAPAKKPLSKAQKKREKRELRDKEFLQKISQEADSSEPDAAKIEKDKLAQQLDLEGLCIKDINPDGHCLYSAISDQLLLKDGLRVGVAELRGQCADYIGSHRQELQPFLVDSTTGEIFTEEKYALYLSELRNTASWGGELELRALSHVYQHPILVHQADCPALRIGGEYNRHNTLHLTYHKHQYGLGAHYNSAAPATH